MRFLYYLPFLKDGQASCHHPPSLDTVDKAGVWAGLFGALIRGLQ